MKTQTPTRWNITLAILLLLAPWLISYFLKQDPLKASSQRARHHKLSLRLCLWLRKCKNVFSWNFLELWFLFHRWWFCPPATFVCRWFLVVMAKGEVSAGIWWAKARDAAKAITVCRMPHSKELSGPHVNGAEVEKSCSRPNKNKYGKNYWNIHDLTSSMPISWETKVCALEKHQKWQLICFGGDSL